VQTDTTKVVTYSAGSYYYIQDVDATSGEPICGIKCKPKTGQTKPVVGKLVQVTGTLDVVDGEAYIKDAVATGTTTGSYKPVAVTQKVLGGALFGAQPAAQLYNPDADEWNPMLGLSNVGTYVMVTGKVTAVDSDNLWFSIDDGSAQSGWAIDTSNGETMFTGVKVSAVPSTSIGQYVSPDNYYTVRGVLGIENYNGNYQRVIWVMGEDDVWQDPGPQ